MFKTQIYLRRRWQKKPLKFIWFCYSWKSENADEWSVKPNHESFISAWHALSFDVDVEHRKCSMKRWYIKSPRVKCAIQAWLLIYFFFQNDIRLDRIYKIKQNIKDIYFNLQVKSQSVSYIPSTDFNFVLQCYSRFFEKKIKRVPIS